MCFFNRPPAFWGHHAEGSLCYWRGFSLCYLLLAILALTRFCLVITIWLGSSHVFDSSTNFGCAIPLQIQDKKLFDDSTAYIKSREIEWQRRPFINLWLQDSPCADQAFYKIWEGTRAYKTDAGLAAETVKISLLDNLNLCTN